MIKSIKLITALLLISTLFTSCTKEETPILKPAVTIYDFQGNYTYLSNGRPFTLVIRLLESFNGFETETKEIVSFIYGANRNETLTGIYQIDDVTLGGTYNWDGIPSGNIIMFIHTDGSRRMTIDQDGEITYRILEVD